MIKKTGLGVKMCTTDRAQAYEWYLEWELENTDAIPFPPPTINKMFQTVDGFWSLLLI